MGNVIMCAGGGGVKSDDVTATLANVLEGKTALTSDSDDDVGVGTMPECGAITLAPTGNNTLTSGEGHYDSVTADGSLAYAAGFSYGFAQGVASLTKISVNFNAWAHAYDGYQSGDSGTAVFTKTNGVWVFSSGAQSAQTQTFTSGAPFAGGATVNSVSLS